MSLKDITFGDLDRFNVITEIPQGSPTKIEYDPESDSMKVDFVFTDNFLWAFNYGFVPETLTEDGEAQDVIIIANHPIKTGTVLSCRAIGMIGQIDRGEVDHKLLAVAVDDAEQTHVKDINDLDKDYLPSVTAAYAEVARQKKKTIEITGLINRDTSRAMLQQARDNFLKQEH